ncbi:MAG: SRPBCC family protein [Candidatus Dormibacteraeota bacterium]|nr:SRPBCC family protein [Candidatus Dormibacteraeota bacterium]
MAVKSKPVVSLTMPSDRELVITAVLDAPRQLVFEASTNPAHVRHWWGPRRTTMTSCEIDLRPGGRWRYVLRDTETGREDGWSGVYREIVAPERVVYTEGWEGMPGHEYLVTATLTEQDGKTTLTSHLLYQSVADRDGHVNSGMEPGMRETYDRFGEYLASRA